MAPAWRTRLNITITASYATGSAAAQSSDYSVVAGGLIGRSSGGTITASYAAGRVSGRGCRGRRCEWHIGGLVGTSGKSITITDSYWDTRTSGVSYSAGGVGKTTRELQSPTANTGIYANWNLDWWDFGMSHQYPALKYGGMDVGAQRR